MLCLLVEREWILSVILATFGFQRTTQLLEYSSIALAQTWDEFTSSRQPTIHSFRANTGMPQTTYGGNVSGPFGGAGAGHQIPAATGPAGMSNGFGGYGAQQSNNNPFGQGPQQGHSQGGGDLIQF